MRWKDKDIRKLQKSSRIPFEPCSVKKPKGKKPNKAPQPEPKALAEIKLILHAAGILFLTEHRFHDKRMFRFDIAIPKHKLAIEYEGIVSAKSRHTSLTGFTRDCDKYNLAQAMGWRVLRYTTLNYKKFPDDLKACTSIDVTLPTS